METVTKPSPALPAVTLGMTFLLMGLTFGLPLQVVPPNFLHEAFPHYSAETGNVFAFVAWAGWAHFVFAYRGQIQAITRPSEDLKVQKLLLFIATLSLIVLILVIFRSILGLSLFSGLVWVYFIDHFVKSEWVFDGNHAAQNSFLRRWGALYQPLLAFSWLTIVLNNVLNVIAYPWVLWGTSIAMGSLFLLAGGWKRLAHGEFRGPILSLLFVAEAVVWGSVGRYAGPTFLVGVYVFHVAAASYFHYLGSYFYASHTFEARQSTIRLGPVLVVNVIVMALGIIVVRTDSLSVLKPVLGLEWFTLWVAAHLIMSDVFRNIKAWQGFKPRQSELAG
jgi:hypothetical protein